jgi:hypothetical protein
MAAKNLPDRMTRRSPAPLSVVGERAEDPAVSAPLVEVPSMEPARAAAVPFRKPPKPFPHRMSLDLDEATYSWLRDVAHENRVRMGPLVRELLSAARRDEELLVAVTNVVKDSAT